MQSPITIHTRRKTINFLLEFEQDKLFKYISNLKYLVTHRQLNRKMIQNKVIDYVNVEGVNIEKPFSNGSETTTWWKKFIYYVENNECKMKSHPYWEDIATNSPISFGLAYDSDGRYVLFEPLPSTEFVDDCDVDTVIDEDNIVDLTDDKCLIDKPNQDTVFKTVNHDQFNRTIPIIQVMKQASKRSREDENEVKNQDKKYKPVTTGTVPIFPDRKLWLGRTSSNPSMVPVGNYSPLGLHAFGYTVKDCRECRYSSFCINTNCIFVHPENIIPGPHNRKCKYGVNCRTLGCNFNHK